MANKKKGVTTGEAFGIIGLTLGILSIIFIGSNGVLLALVGFTFSYIQHRRNPTKISKAGIIVNIIGFVLAIIFVVIAIKYLAPLIEQQMQGLA